MRQNTDAATETLKKSILYGLNRYMTWMVPFSGSLAARGNTNAERVKKCHGLNDPGGGKKQVSTQEKGL